MSLQIGHESQTIPQACDIVMNYGILLLDRDRFAEAQRAVILCLVARGMFSYFSTHCEAKFALSTPVETSCCRR